MLIRVLTGQFYEIVLIWRVSFHPRPLNKDKKWRRKLPGCGDKDGSHDCGCPDSAATSCHHWFPLTLTNALSSLRENNLAYDAVPSHASHVILSY